MAEGKNWLWTQAVLWHLLAGVCVLVFTHTIIVIVMMMMISKYAWSKVQSYIGTYEKILPHCHIDLWESKPLTPALHTDCTVRTECPGCVHSSHTQKSVATLASGLFYSVFSLRTSACKETLSHPKMAHYRRFPQRVVSHSLKVAAGTVGHQVPSVSLTLCVSQCLIWGNT